MKFALAASPDRSAGVQMQAGIRTGRHSAPACPRRCRRTGLGTLLGMMVCMWLAVPADATTWTVNSQSSIDHAVANAQPGDTIVVQNGVYNFPVRLNGANGTAENPITFRAETIGGVTFTGNNLSSNAKLQLTRDHWVIDGFNFDNIKIAGEASTNRLTVVRLSGANHNVVRNITINDSGLSSANPHSNAANNTMFLHLTQGSKSNIIERNRFTNNSNNIVVRVGGGPTDVETTDNVFRFNHFSGHAGYETLQLSWGGASDVPLRTIVEHNLWEGNASTSELISSKTSENVFRYNTFADNNDQLVLRSGNNSVIESNYFIDGRGIRAFGEGHTIVNNYLEGSFGPESGNQRGGILLGAGADGDNPYAAFRHGVVANNTIVNTGNFGLIHGHNYDFTWQGETLDVAPFGNLLERNLIVNEEGVAIFKNAGAADINTWIDNLVWSILNGSNGYIPGDGVDTDIDPELLRDALGNYIASAVAGVGAQMPYRRLTVDDVGPGSTYVPEPGSLGLAAVLGALLCRRRTRVRC